MKALSRNMLFAGTALSALTLTGAAYAQAQDAASGTLEQVVVTATRQTDTVNRVPLAVSAQTQKALDQQGIRTINDLEATIPSLRITGQEGSGVATITIRGIRQTGGAAATTGFYLDETALQKRNAGGFGSINGTPLPPLFDLDRVEVLRGPQGTLFGGGSEGGTVRYIQPQPSLTRFSSYARAQWMDTKGGDASYEAGVAVGGPIIQDKLGFRASVFQRHNGGWTDLVDYRNGAVYDKNANHGKARMGRLALTWAPTSDIKVTASYFSSRDENHSIQTGYNLPVAGTLTVPALCYDTIALTAQPVGSPGRTVPVAFAGGPGCNGRAGQPGVVITPGYSIGPLNLKTDQSLLLGPNSVSTDTNIGSIDASWEFGGGFTLRSITSYTQDKSTGSQPQAFLNALVSYRNAGGATYVEAGSPTRIINAGIPYDSNVTSTPNGLGLGAYLQPTSRNQRYGLSQEVRLSSPTDTGPLSFVAGVYFANTRAKISQTAVASDLGFVQLAGLTLQQRYGVPNPGFFARILETDKDVEIAGFADATLKIGDHVRVTGGLRVTHITTNFTQTNYGPNGFTLTPQVSDGTLVTGQITEDPVTPKLSLQYLITPDQLIYATASKGFRAGGVNQVFSSAGQGQFIGQYGLTKAVLPVTYGSDSVWSYELGVKLRLLHGLAQVNADIYRIDWSNVQSNVNIGGDGVIFNAPSARSHGFEFEGQLRPIRALTLNTSVAYGKAVYTSGISIPAGRPGVLPFQPVINGQEFAQPKWTVDAGARYDANLTADVKGYARVDYRWLEHYALNIPGSPNYTPDSAVVPSIGLVNLRVGVEYHDFDINLFANNLTNNRKGALAGGRSSCTNTDCSAFNNYSPFFTVNAQVPRQIGIQVAYRH